MDRIGRKVTRDRIGNERNLPVVLLQGPVQLVRLGDRNSHVFNKQEAVNIKQEAVNIVRRLRIRTST